MPEGSGTLEDRHHTARLAIAIPAAFLLGASGFFNATIRLLPDGTHGDVTGIEPVRTLVLVFVALIAVASAARPMKPDPRIAQAVMLAAAIIGLVIGLDGIIGPQNDPTRAPGVAPYLQLLSTAAFLTLRWKKSLWPTSQWILEAKEAAAVRSGSRRGR